MNRLLSAASLLATAAVATLSVPRASASLSGSACPSELKQLKVIQSTLDRVLSHREIDSNTIMPLWRLAREVNSELNYGSRDDLGEREHFNLFFLEPESEAFVLERLKTLETLATSPKELVPVAKAASELVQVLPARNLYRDRDWTPEKLACLAGADFEEVLSLEKEFDLERVPLETLRKSRGDLSVLPADFDAKIQSAVRYEENIWPDTVLEGEVGQNGPAVAQDIEVILLRGKFMAVELTISAPAVFTGNGNCRYNEKRKQWVGRDCAPGQISVRKTLNHRMEPVGSMNFAEFD